MLNGVKVTIKAGGSFDPIPADKYQLQVLDVALIKSFNKFKGEEVDMLNYQFGVLNDNPMPEGSDPKTTRGKYLWKRCSLSLNKKAWLNKLVIAVTGTEPDVATFDPESLVGKQVCAFVEETPAKDDPSTIYNNITSFMKAPKLMEELDNKANSVVQEKSSTPVDMPEDDPEAVIKKLNAEK
jgi:hypothetical protein